MHAKDDVIEAATEATTEPTIAAAQPGPSLRSGPLGVMRGAWRLLRIAAVLGRAWIHFRSTRERSLFANAEQMRFSSERMLRVAKIPVTVQGPIPAEGLIVSNHLGYLDVMVLGSLVRSAFVSKEEVRSWPFVGGLVAAIGTIFLKRESIRAAAEVNRVVAKTMRDGLPVVFFPEGTTTGGNELLPFQPALFDGAVKAHQPIHPVAIRYTLNGSDQGVRDNVCYWGDRVFGPHLLRLMLLNGIAAQVIFAEAPVEAASRGEAAERSHQVVGKLLERLHAPVAKG